MFSYHVYMITSFSIKIRNISSMMCDDVSCVRYVCDDNILTLSLTGRRMPDN